MQAMVLTVIGKDRAGLVDTIAKCVFDVEGNWLRSSFCQLSGQFAGFIEVVLPMENQQRLIECCNAINELSITLVPTQNTQANTGQLCQFKVTANDRKGIISDIASTLNNLNINIIEMNTDCSSAPNWGNPVFTANVSIMKPNIISLDDVKSSIENISDDLMIEIEETDEG